MPGKGANEVGAYLSPAVLTIGHATHAVDHAVVLAAVNGVPEIGNVALG